MKIAVYSAHDYEKKFLDNTETGFNLYLLKMH
jgi:hypothetical protein